jgi:hypothetical protein
MQKYDLALYGHLTKDRIYFSDFRQKLSIGAAGNVWEAFTKVHPSLSLSIQPLALGEAIILVDTVNGSRLGRGRLNSVTQVGRAINANWHHIMYLNQLKDVSFIRDIEEGIISVDVTSGEMRNIEMLQYVDYMFISDEDLFMSLEELSNLVRGWVVLHYPTGSIITNGKKTYKTETVTIKNLNVLGAGDYYAGCFIGNLLKNERLSLSKCAEMAHKDTLQVLREVNSENSK